MTLYRSFIALSVAALAALTAASCGQMIENEPKVQYAATGYLVEADGTPAAGAWVRLRSATDSFATVAGPGGTYGFQEVTDGEYVLAAGLQRGDTVLALYRTGVMVAGKTGLGTDTLRETGSVAVQVRTSSGNPLPGALCTAGNGAWQVLSDSLGVCLLTGLQAGTVRVTVTHPALTAPGSKDITVLSGIVTSGGLIQIPDGTTPPPDTTPRQAILIATQDAHITGSAPGLAASSNSSLNYGKMEILGIGVYDRNSVFRLLVQIELPPGLTGARVSKAVFRLYSHVWTTKNVHPDSVRIHVHQLLRSWKEGNSTGSNSNNALLDGASGLERYWGSQDGSEDWNQRLVGLNDIDAQAAIATSVARPNLHIGYWEFDLTSVAKAWADNPAQNFGIVLRTDIPSANSLVEDYPNFHSKDAPIADSLKPHLILTYRP